jgi:hypothetical protein
MPLPLLPMFKSRWISTGAVAWAGAGASCCMSSSSSIAFWAISGIGVASATRGSSWLYVSSRAKGFSRVE